MNATGEKKIWKYQDGRLYFTKQAERKVLFILTVVMMFFGIIVKLI
jgi:hypothetical protein